MKVVELQSEASKLKTFGSLSIGRAFRCASSSSKHIYLKIGINRFSHHYNGECSDENSNAVSLETGYKSY